MHDAVGLIALREDDHASAAVHDRTCQSGGRETPRYGDRVADFRLQVSFGGRDLVSLNTPPHDTLMRILSAVETPQVRLGLQGLVYRVRLSLQAGTPESLHSAGLNC